MRKALAQTILSDAIYVAVAPVFAYVFSYAFERGYATHFKYPEELISLTLANILQFSAVVIAFLITTLFLLNGFSFLFLKHASPYFAHYVPRFALFAYLWTVIPFFMFGFRDFAYFLLPTTFVVFTGILLFILPITENRSIPKWADRFDKQWTGNQSRPDTLLSVLNERLGRNTSMVIAVLFSLFSLTFLAGIAAATNKKEFLVFKGDNECVVLRTFGETLVCAPFDRTEKIVSREYRFIKIGEAKDTSFVVEQIGPLTPRK